MKRRIRVFSVIVLSLFASTMVFGSGQTENEKTQDNMEDVKTLGLVTITANDSSNARFIEGATNAATELGWKTLIIDAHGSAEEANSAMQNLVLRKVDAIIDLVFPVSSLGSGLMAANDAGVVVGTWGGGLGNSVVATNGTGGIQAIPIVKQMVDDLGGSGSILALTYHIGEVAREREFALDDIVSNYPNIEVTKNEVNIPGSIQNGAEYASAWLAAHPKGSGPLAIWGAWDDPALGAIATLKQQGRDDVKVYGQNGNVDAITAVKEGWMTATAWAPVEEEGKVMVNTLNTVLNSDTWTPKAVEVPVIVVNENTIDQFLIDHPEADGE